MISLINRFFLKEQKKEATSIKRQMKRRTRRSEKNWAKVRRTIVKMTAYKIAKSSGNL